jgi:hypothetical protein
MQLVVAGRIKRCNGRLVAVQTVQHEFRTAGGSAEQRSLAAAPKNPPAILTSREVLGALGKL